MGRRAQLTLEEKTKVIVLSELNLSNREIARQLKCSEGCVRYICKKYRETGKISRKKGSGAQMKTSPAEDRLLKRLCLNNRFETASKLANRFEEDVGKKLSSKTICRRLNSIGLKARRPAKKPLLTATMKKQRLAWAKEKENWSFKDWCRVIFSDESKFNLISSDGNQRVRRRTGERYSSECLQPTVKHSPYVMVWGCLTSAGVGKLIMIEGSIDAKKYKFIIKEGVIPTMEEFSSVESDILFQDDNAPCHRAKSITEFKNKLGIKSLNWAGNSPDLNIIENVWAKMGKEIRNKEPRTILQLKNTIEDVWYNKIDLNYIKKLYLSMPQRTNAVIKAKGGTTRF